MLTAALAAPPSGVLALDPGPEDLRPWPDFERLGARDAARWSTPPTAVVRGTWPDSLGGDGLVGGALALGPSEAVRHVRLLLGRPSAGTVRIHAAGHEVEVDTGRWEALDGQPTLTPQRPSLQEGTTTWERFVRPLQPWHLLVLPPGDDGIVRVDGAPLAAVVVSDRADEEAAAGWLDEVDARRRAAFRVFTPGLDGAMTTGATEDMPLSVLLTAPDEAPEADRSRQAPPTQTLVVDAGVPTTVLVWCYPDDRPVTLAVEGLDPLAWSAWEVVWADGVGHPDGGRFEPRWLVPLADAAAGGQGVPVALALTLHATADARAGRASGALVLTRAPEVVRVPLRVEVRTPSLPDPLDVRAVVSPDDPRITAALATLGLRTMAPTGDPAPPVAPAELWWASLRGDPELRVGPTAAASPGPAPRPLALVGSDGRPWVSLGAVALAMAADDARWIAALRERVRERPLATRLLPVLTYGRDLLDALEGATPAPGRPGAPWPPEALAAARAAVRATVEALPP